MPPKKDIPLVAEPIDWVRIIQALATAAVLIMSTWVTLTMNRVESKVVTVEAKVDKVKAQTDGMVTASLKALAIAAENLAAAKKTPESSKAASEAWDAYDARVRLQEKVESLPEK